MRSSFGADDSSGGTIGCSCGSALCCSPSTSSIGVVDEVRREVLELLFREVDVLQRLHDLVVGQESLFLALLHESVELLDVRKGDIDGEHEPLFLPGGWRGQIFETSERTQLGNRPSNAVSRTSTLRLRPFGGGSYTRLRRLERGSVAARRQGSVTSAVLLDNAQFAHPFAVAAGHLEATETLALDAKPPEHVRRRRCESPERAVDDLESDRESVG